MLVSSKSLFLPLLDFVCSHWCPSECASKNRPQRMYIFQGGNIFAILTASKLPWTKFA